ncbi:hypothetical protein GEMRC1_001282 [Eukaryota sp. GEM-RC1]
MNIDLPLIISEEVQSALESGLPIVALESTIITHGMPYPQNLETARDVEAIVREHGSIPATIAIINGIIHAGLVDVQLESLAKGGDNVVKASRRDLGYVLMKKLSAGTTVSATMLICKLANIPIFATGGLGGVSRGYDQILDISTDLTEFAKSNIMVVSAGCKSIMDIPNTLEYLETEGIPVVGYQTLDCPSFYSQRSGIKLPCSVDSALEAAVLYKYTQAISPSGVLVANPIPKEFEIPNEEIEPVISEALDDASSNDVSGKDVTPYLLKAIVEKTGGKSLVTNIHLIKNNAKLASQIAVELSKL